MGEGGRDEEVGSSKKKENELNTRLQNAIPYL